MTNPVNSVHFFLNLVNFMYLVCGMSLVVSSIVVLDDVDRILISRLLPIDSHEPILYYVSLFTLVWGLLISTLSTIGYWAFYIENNCLSATYVFGVVALLLSEGVFGIVTITSPQYFGLDINKEALMQLWQNNYAIPGKDQYTVAIDLFQVKFKCCGVNNSDDYGASLWHVKLIKESYAPNLKVPMSCCYLNDEVTMSYLDPVPIDLLSCQDTNVEKFHMYRHNEGCYFSLQNWLKKQTLTILLFVAINLVVQLFILFCVAHRQMVYDANKNNKSHSTHRSSYSSCPFC